jgi:hypothetical protein
MLTRQASGSCPRLYVVWLDGLVTLNCYWDWELVLVWASALQLDELLPARSHEAAPAIERKRHSIDGFSLPIPTVTRGHVETDPLTRGGSASHRTATDGSISAHSPRNCYPSKRDAPSRRYSTGALFRKACLPDRCKRMQTVFSPTAGVIVAVA